MVEIEAFDVKARKKVKIKDPQVITLKNGRYAVKGKSPLTGITVFRIISKEEAEKLKK